MSAKQVSNLGSFENSVNVASRAAALELSADKVSVHKNGIEFRSPAPFPEWAEMTVSLQSPLDGGRLSGHGVVVSCSGNKHAGYLVSMIFTSLTKQAQARLNTLARSELGL
jgi:hypothetical protein